MPNRAISIPDLGRPFRLLDFDVAPIGARFEVEKLQTVIRTEAIGGMSRDRAMEIRGNLIKWMKKRQNCQLFLVMPSKYINEEGNYGR